ncbi:AAA family ATPase [Parasphingorhabdus sp.]|uniref:AAA family ATPase n=1 Tax=Parasphingorhabdus sp. TaxID=2709688 RepID=UPI003001D0BE
MRVSSVLDRQITLSRFKSASARQVYAHQVTIRELGPKIVKRSGAQKSELPWLKLASFGKRKTGKGSLRHNANVIAIEGVEGDYDGETISPAKAAQMLRKSGIAGLIYTSPSHTPDKPRWRILCPTSQSLPPTDRERLCARLHGVLGAALAPESFNLSQAYYYGGVDGQSVPETIMIEGAAIDTLEQLDKSALGKNGKPYRGQSEPIADDIGNHDDFWHVPELDDMDMRPAPHIEKLTSAMDAIPADARDDREQWLKIGAALHYEFDGDGPGFELWSDWSAASDKYDATDQQRVWESFGKGSGKPTTGASIYDVAKNYGWNPKTWDKPKSISRLQLFNPAQCADAPARGYVIKRLIAPGDVACIFGAPGGGKSTIAPYLGFHVARGEEAFGLRTKPGKVLYVAAEDAHGMKGRVTALRQNIGDAPDFYVVDGVSDLLNDDSPDLKELREIVASQCPALIFIDTLAMSFRDLEENDAAAMNRVVSISRSLTCHGAAVILIHHGTKAEGSTPRGHSVLNGALDVALQLIRTRIVSPRCPRLAPAAL